MRNLLIVLGDQLDRQSSGFDGFDPRQDAVWMAEVAEESTHVWTHKARIAVFLSAMRHFRDRLGREKFEVDYTELAASPPKKPPGRSSKEPATLAEALQASLLRLRKAKKPPERLVVVEPGEWRVQASIVAVAKQEKIPLEIRTDRHFFLSKEEFAAHAKGRKQLRLEYFYRPMREKFDVLMDEGEPPPSPRSPVRPSASPSCRAARGSPRASPPSPRRGASRGRSFRRPPGTPRPRQPSVASPWWVVVSCVISRTVLVAVPSANCVTSVPPAESDATAVTTRPLSSRLIL